MASLSDVDENMVAAPHLVAGEAQHGVTEDDNQADIGVEQLQAVENREDDNPQSELIVEGEQHVVVDEDPDKTEDEDEDEAEVTKTSNSQFGWKTVDPKEAICCICMDVWTNHGEHSICCLPCGHIFGMSCIKNWLLSRKRTAAQRSSKYCPQCGVKCSLKDVRRLYASGVLALDEVHLKKYMINEARYDAFVDKLDALSKLDERMEQLEKKVTEFIASTAEKMEHQKQQLSLLTDIVRRRSPSGP